MFDNLFTFSGFIGPSVVFILILSVVLYLVTKYVNIFLFKMVGSTIFHAIASIGVIIHESSHFVACYLFNHRVTEVQFFSVDRYTNTLGFVRHQYRVDSIFQIVGNFFIGIAPLIGGGLMLFLLFEFVFNSLFLNEQLSLATAAMSNSNGLTSYLEAFVHSLPTLSTAIWLDLNSNPLMTSMCIVMCGSIALHMFPSGKDLESSAVGIIALLLLIAGLVLTFEPLIAPLAKGINEVMSALVGFISIGVLSAAIVIATLLPVFLLRFLVKRLSAPKSQHA